MFKKLNRYFRFIRLGIYALFHKGTRNSQNVYSKKEVSLFLTDYFNISNLKTYVLQGICIISDNILITAYDDSKISDSKIMIFNDKCLIHEVYLNTKSHVGGICYDNINNIVWITDSHGTISGYNYDDILSLKEINPLYKRVKVINNHVNIYGNNASSYLTYYKQKLYVGNYNKKKLSAIISYDILNDGSVNLDSGQEIKGLDFIQGITFYENNNETYLLISSSFILKKSIIKIYKISELKEDTLSSQKALASYKFNPTLEQIAVDKNGKLFVVFESNALKYQKYHIKNNDIEVYNINIK